MFEDLGKCLTMLSTNEVLLQKFQCRGKVWSKQQVVLEEVWALRAFYPNIQNLNVQNGHEWHKHGTNNTKRSRIGAEVTFTTNDTELCNNSLLATCFRVGAREVWQPQP